MSSNRNLSVSPKGDQSTTDAFLSLPDELRPHIPSLRPPEDDQSTTDPFARLPAELLPLIVSFLPFPEAVRTCVLSSKWRYTYTSVNSFDFDSYWIRKNCRDIRDDLTDLLHILITLLRENPNPSVPFIRLHGFSEISSAIYTDSTVEAFILTAVEKKVEHLDIIWICKSNAITTLPCRLFTCTSLVKLILHDAHFLIGKLDRLDLPNLKSLSLYGCTFTCPDTLKLFFSGCLLLEELDLMTCIFDQRDIFISIPSLKMLFISNDRVPTQCNLLNCTSLVMLNLVGVELSFKHPDRLPNLKTVSLLGFHFNEAAMMFFSKCLVLEELVLKECTFRSKLVSIVTPSLKKLMINYMCFQYSSGNGFVLCLQTPALEYLKFCNMICEVFFEVDSKPLIQVDHLITNDSALHSSFNDGYTMQMFVVGVCNVGMLTLSDWSQKILTRYGFQLPIFGNLVHLNLGRSGEFTWEIVMRLPKCAPNLEILDFYEGLPSYSTPPLFSKDLNVKLICIRGFTGWDGEVSSLKHLMDNTKFLKMIVIQGSSSLHVELLRKLFNELTGKKKRFKLSWKKVEGNDYEVIFWVVRFCCRKEEEPHEEEEEPQEEEMEFFPYSSLYYPRSY